MAFIFLYFPVPSSAVPGLLLLVSFLGFLSLGTVTVCWKDRKIIEPFDVKVYTYEITVSKRKLKSYLKFFQSLYV